MKYSHRPILIIFAFFTICTAETAYYFSGGKYFTDQILTDAIDTTISVEDNISRILDLYVEKGFPFATVKVDSVLTGIEGGAVYLKINSGSYVRIDEILFEGAVKTAKSSMLTLSGLKKGEKFSEKKSAEASEWLYRSGLFLYRPGFDIFRSAWNKFGLSYKVAEKKYNEIIFLGGYSSGSEGSVLSFLSVFNSDNLFGTMRRISFLWERTKDYSEKFDLKYTEPFLFGMHLSTTAEFRQDFRNDLYLKRSVYAGQKYEFDPEAGVKYGFLKEFFYPDTLAVTDRNDAVTTKYHAGVEYSVKSGEYPVEGDGGFSLSADVASVNISVKDSADMNGFQIKLNPGYIIEFTKRIFIGTGINYEQAVFTGRIPDFGKISFGGAGSFRGYREDMFLSDIEILNSWNVFFVPERGIAFRLFGDLCAYNPSAENIEKISGLDVLYSYGAGMIYITDSGEISLTVAVPHSEGFGDSVIHAKYSFRF